MNHWMMAILLVLALPPCGLSAGYPEPFPLTIEERIALQVHFSRRPTLDENQWNQLSETGIRVIRTDLYWSWVERQRGVYTWDFYDDLTRQLASRRIRPLFVIGYPNTALHSPVTVTRSGKVTTYVPPPQTPEDIMALARMAGEAAERYQSCNPIWEIWNEPDTPQFWPPKGDVEAYIRMAVPVTEAIRKKQPNAVIIAPSMSAVPSWHYHPDFMPAVLRSDLGRLIDAISIHPYRNSEPESVLRNMDLLTRYIREARPDRKGSLHYLFSEWGYSTAKEVRTEEMQAAYLVRCQMVGLMAGAWITTWYDWRDDGDDPNDREHRFGITRRNGERKSAYYALVQLLSELRGYTYEKRIAMKDDRNYALLFTKPGAGRKVVAWNSGDGGSGKLPAEYRASGDARDIMGNRVALKIEDGQLLLKLAPSPLYITLQ